MGTILFADKDYRIFIKTSSEKYRRKLEELGFIPIFYASGFMHTTAFPGELKHTWRGTAREFFGNANRPMYKIFLANAAAENIK